VSANQVSWGHPQWGHLGGLLDVIDDRSASALVSWIKQRNVDWRAGIAVAALDPYRAYASA
jgi:hypothetical protein